MTYHGAVTISVSAAVAARPEAERQLTVHFPAGVKSTMCKARPASARIYEIRGGKVTPDSLIGTVSQRDTHGIHAAHQSPESAFRKLWAAAAKGPQAYYAVYSAEPVAKSGGVPSIKVDASALAIKA
jgi:type 1 fimbria pilin